MKRMYVTLGAILLLFVWAISCLGQKINSDDKGHNIDQLKHRMELREEMHRRMRDKILHGIGPDQDLFKDIEQMFEDSMSDAFTGMDQFQIDSDNFKSEWMESKSGRTLVITPKDKDQKLSIDVNETAITIKGETQHRTSTSTYSSSFSNSFPVPDDCDGTKVKMDQKDGKIMVQLPFKTGKSSTNTRILSPKEEERKPLPPSEDDVTI